MNREKIITEMLELSDLYDMTKDEKEKKKIKEKLKKLDKKLDLYFREKEMKK